MIRLFNYPEDSIESVLSRSQLDKGEVIDTVRTILADVKARGDEAVFFYTKKFDNLSLGNDNIEVSRAEIEKAYSEVSQDLILSLRRAKDNILSYHLAQKNTNKFLSEGGKKLGTILRPLKRAGIYAPGGTAPYPSSVLMTALVAKAAGVEEIILCSPNPRNPLTIVAAAECGVSKILKIGGAQAVAAMAYGTECVPKVDVIAGPGNIYVTLAKKEVFGEVKIDMIAGPSEILIIADKNAKAELIAADLLGQAEHDKLSASILITDSLSLAKEVKEELAKQTEELERKDIITESLANNGALIVVSDLKEACRISNLIAPEHLELMCKDADSLIDLIENAGAIFVGDYSPEPLGDYFAGPSHVLPTSGTARYFEALNTDTFMKKISYIKYEKEDLMKAAKDIYSLANAEGFTAHANTIKRRVAKEDLQ